MKILYNAKIITLDPQHPTASALVINHHLPLKGHILAVGETDQIRTEFGALAEAEDMHGAVILPGLTDAHIHLRYYALNLAKLNLFNLSKRECLDLVARTAAEARPGEWILGHGWNQNDWPEGLPSAAELDQAAPNNPTYLTHVSLHSAWVNRSALQAAGIDDTSPDPSKESDAHIKTGKPFGVLLEDAANVVEDVIPEPSQVGILTAIEKAQQTLWQFGLTGIHDFDRIPSFVALQKLHSQGRLKLRVLKNLPVESLEQITAVGLRSGFGDDLLRIGGIKAFADGALGPHTAAMLAPYENEPQNRGLSFIDSEELFEIGRQAAEVGLNIAVHAIGDAANHAMLAGFAQLREYERSDGLPALRHRIEHVQVLHPDDLSRLAELDLIASMQPIHATADMYMADKYWGSRARYAYAWRSLQQTGTRLAFGSDAPVDTPNPFYGLHAAVTRRRGDGTPGPEGWYPQERISLESALHGYTTGPAYAAGMEDRLGRLTPGHLADLIALARDPFEVAAEELYTLNPNATMVGGEWVWKA